MPGASDREPRGGVTQHRSAPPALRARSCVTVGARCGGGALGGRRPLGCGRFLDGVSELE